MSNLQGAGRPTPVIASRGLKAVAELSNSLLVPVGVAHWAYWIDPLTLPQWPPFSAMDLDHSKCKLGLDETTVPGLRLQQPWGVLHVRLGAWAAQLRLNSESACDCLKVIG